MEEGEERRLCSLGVVPGQGLYQCRLNLGQEKYCGQVADFVSLLRFLICHVMIEVCILGDGN